ncbi:MAG: DUF6473 family protein [Pseudomonadota bacterium]
MSYAGHGSELLDYKMCSYGVRGSHFRGPERCLEDPYIAVLGGNATFGRFVAEPFADRLEQQLRQPVVNLGAMNAGLDMYVHQPELMRLVAGAEKVVIQIMGAANISNNFYRVHPRRNDRFLHASDALRELYSDIDFTEFHFTRHLLLDLHRRSPERLAVLVRDLRKTWLQRMLWLLTKLQGKVILLWAADDSPCLDPEVDFTSAVPIFVTKSMVDSVRPLALSYVEVVTDEAERSHRTQHMLFTEPEALAARRMLPVSTHATVAQRLAAEM